MIQQRCRTGLGAARYRKDRHSFGLVAVLLLLALVTVSVTSLLFLVARDRTANSDYAEQVRAQEEAMAGIQTTIADLRQEMQAGSTIINPANGGQVWLPNAAATMRIVAISNAPAAFTHLRSSSPFTPSTFFPPPNYTGTLPLSRASVSSTTNYSQDGRTIPYPTFWDKTYLYPSTLPIASKPPPPSWIYIQRGGVSTNALTWSNTLRDQSAGNSSYVLGRYAFQLYDTGGLLDLNVAGAPAGANMMALEGTLAGASLTNLPGMSSQNVSDIIQFRNPTETNSASYVAAITNILSATNGFMTTSPGNNRFFSRGDLIRYAQQDGFTSALPYLTHFSRDLNAPSWIPGYDAASPYTYRTSATTTGSTNRFMASVSSPGEAQTYYTISGASMSTNLAAGQPRLWKRFPLARISWLQNPPAASLNNAILANFGLVYNSSTGRWIYSVSGSLTPDSTILNLDSIPAGRAPNFFELLKAGILSGSLGTTATQDNMLLTHDSSVDNNVGSTLLQDPNVDYHVLKIGACIIDQYLATAVPTAIDFDYAPTMSADWKTGYRVPAVGSKNLPYIYTASQYATLVNTGTNVLQSGWLEFELWNPYQTNNLTVPTGIQITSGNATNSSTVQGSFTGYGDANFNPDSPGLQATGNRYIQFTPANLINYSKPKTFLASDSNGTSEGAKGDFSNSPAIPQPRRAFYLGTATFTASVAAQLVNYYFGFENIGAGLYTGSINGLPLQLQVQAGSNRIPYLVANLKSISGMRYGVTSTPPMPMPVTWESWGYTPSDPRTTRGGWPYAAKNSSGAYGDFVYNNVYPPTGPDADGVTRTNDVSNVSQLSGFYALYERPMFLGRPFHTPADMGYAFRDQPWKSLDFRSANSADAGLLDLFSVYDDPSVTAGHINLNSAPQPVIQSIVCGSTKNESTATPFSSSDAGTISTAFTNWIATTPMQSRADLASFASTNAITTTALGSATSSTTTVITNNRKFEREGVIRALSGVGQTRTITLLLDIVAQSGRYGSTAASLNDFHVSAQVHYWAHIAIDRFTGQIVDMQIEPVNE